MTQRFTLSTGMLSIDHPDELAEDAQDAREFVALWLKVLERIAAKGKDGPAR